MCPEHPRGARTYEIATRCRARGTGRRNDVDDDGRTVTARPTDPRAYMRQIARAREDALAGDRARGATRAVVTESWERSLAASVDPESSRPWHAYERREVDDLRDGHPLAPVIPLLRDTLVAIADQANHMMIVTDAQGHILWREGARDVLRRADLVELVEGTRWSEESIGTNAMGTALAADSPVQIHSSEHLVRTYHQWTCAASPIHDPDSGATIGVVDVTGPLETFHPTTMSLVTAAARLAENHLTSRMALRDEVLRARNLPHLAGLGGAPGALLSSRGRVLAAQPLGWISERIVLPDEGDRVLLGEDTEGVLEPLAEGYLLRILRPGGRKWASLSLPFLGARRPVARLDGRAVRLSLRHAELLTLLALHPEGLNADQLATGLYGDAGNPVTVRAEMHRLRCHLDEGVIRTQPYRLHASVDADFLEVRDALRSGRIRDAADDAARGPLLPTSEAPAVRAEREQLEANVRAAVVRCGDPDAMWALARTDEGRHDTELVARLLRALPTSDPRHAELSAR
ncbi:GAF domain-containing protein [Pseudonocardia endophytica]|uniref:GAF domain-containing protein n=1 Tax=Pseudonocardia endophytica TaxID=401976 RepID=A0A4R1HHR8_PSEEN|nr:GAF domain-containing protein [Pseudonocardia endophytica]